MLRVQTDHTDGTTSASAKELILPNGTDYAQAIELGVCANVYVCASVLVCVCERAGVCVCERAGVCVLPRMHCARDVIQIYIWDRFREKGPNTCFFQDFNFYLLLIFYRSLKCPLHVASYALRIRVSVMEF